VEKRGPPLSGLILVMMDEDVGGICPTIIWLWSGTLTSIWLTVGADKGQGLGRFPVFSIASSWACRLEMIFAWRSPTPTPALINGVFKGVNSFSWAAPEQGERALFRGWDMWVPTGDGTEPCGPARLGEAGYGC